MQVIHIKLEKGQKLFFISDMHLGHKNVIQFSDRPFVSVKDMEKQMIENWNSVVSKNDIVFDLGDMFWFDGRHDAATVISKLNGTIYKIPGNHDMNCTRLFELCSPKKVKICDDIVQLFVKGLDDEAPTAKHEIWLSHFPFATFPHKEKSQAGFPVIQLFGHIHSGPLAEKGHEYDIPGKDLFLMNDKQYDVGVDNNNYTPVEIREIYEKLSKN